LDPSGTFFGGPQKIAEDEPQAAKEQPSKSLYKLSDASGKLTFTQIATGNIHRNSLDSNDVFILDGGFEVYVWIGLKASASERKKGLSFAANYLQEYNRPNYLPIVRVPEGAENEVFNSLFS